VSNKIGNVKPVLCAKGNSNDRVSVVTKRVSSGKACVNRVCNDSDSNIEKRSPNKSADRKSVSHRTSQESKRNVNVNVDQSPVSRRRSQREKPVETCSESESDTDKRHTFTRRRSFIRPDRFDGVSPSFATFKAHFENAAQFNQWREKEQLAHLKASLVGAASQCLWDQSPECVNTLEKLWKLLSDRFAGQNLTEKYRTELRNRRRKSGESLDSLCSDVRRLLIMGYPGPTSTAHEAIAKDSFIGALDSELSMKVRERDPATLDEALHTALRLETIREAATSVRDVSDDNVRYKNKHVRGINTGCDQSAISSVLTKMNEMQSRLDKDLKAIGDRMTDVEIAVRQPRQPDVTVSSQPVRTWTSTAPVPSSNSNSYSVPTSTVTPNFPSQRGCYNCGDLGHMKRNCPRPKRSGYSGSSSVDQGQQGHNGTDGSASAATRGSRNCLDNGHVYLVANIDGRRHLALIDSGCELSLAPSSVVGDRVTSRDSECVCSEWFTHIYSRRN